MIIFLDDNFLLKKFLSVSVILSESSRVVFNDGYDYRDKKAAENIYECPSCSPCWARIPGRRTG